MPFALTPVVALIVAAASPSPIASQPLHFIENCGQWDGEIAFAARCRDGSAWIERDGLAFASRSGSSVQLRFEGARTDVVLDPRELVRGVYSFFLGGDPRRWRGGVRAHRVVRQMERRSARNRARPESSDIPRRAAPARPDGPPRPPGDPRW